LPGHFDLMDRRDRDHPFRLVTAPARNYLNTSFTETPSSQGKEGRPRAKIHPAAAADLGIAAGDRIRLGNRQGSLLIEAELFAGLQRDVVVVESIWPNSAFIEGVGINLLTSADAAPPKGGAVFHDTAIWVRPDETR
ncbi:MAG TPA: molybdopterin dinucleotide binding domain-containing protein, partial [Kiloniellaceae bacterium]|nr:molybdopterin dinucleotide binding domain-containing protein [Kiloniellaceae bacterium]